MGEVGDNHPAIYRLSGCLLPITACQPAATWMWLGLVLDGADQGLEPQCGGCLQTEFCQPGTVPCAEGVTAIRIL